MLFALLVNVSNDSDVELQNDVVTAPVSALFCREMIFKFFKEASAAGIVPCNWLSFRKSDCRDIRFTNVVGMFPMMWFEAKFSDIKAESFPIAGGMDPYSALLGSFRPRKVSKSPSAGVSTPVS